MCRCVPVKMRVLSPAQCPFNAAVLSLILAPTKACVRVPFPTTISGLCSIHSFIHTILYLSVSGIKPRTTHRQSTCSITELHSWYLLFHGRTRSSAPPQMPSWGQNKVLDSPVHCSQSVITVTPVITTTTTDRREGDRRTKLRVQLDHCMPDTKYKSEASVDSTQRKRAVCEANTQVGHS